MQELNCLIIEDEPLAAGIIRDYISQIPGLGLKAICGDVFTASPVLRTDKIDIIFLDINLPGVNGLEFIQTLRGNYHIILTTAYHEFALDAFNLNAVDYLLKPIEFSRFLQAVNKVYALLPASDSEQPTESKVRQSHFFLVDKMQVKVFIDEILFVEGLKDYIRIHTMTGNIVTKLPLAEMNALLEGHNFCRIHKSWIVNLDRMVAYNAQEVNMGKVRLPIGRTFSEMFKQRAGK
jgi:DNA-binding LytR/AlgR family response regulator